MFENIYHAYTEFQSYRKCETGLSKGGLGEFGGFATIER